MDKPKDFSTEDLLDELDPKDFEEAVSDETDRPTTKAIQDDVHDVDASLVKSIGDMAIKRTQYIPDSFLDDLKRERDESHKPAGDYHRFASIPVAVVEMWKKRDGFDVYKEKPKDIIKKLKAEGLDAFLTSNKRM